MDVIDSYRTEQDQHYVRPMENLLSKLNSATGRGIEFHPVYSPALRTGSSLYVGYKLRDKTSRPDRVLELLIGESEYVKDPFGRWGFSSDKLRLIMSEIERFFNGVGPDTYRATSIPCPIS
jgi:hypothetical protein